MTHRLAPVITWRSSLVQGTDCSTCKLVGLVLSLYMNERGGSAFPSVPTLAADCSLSPSTVREHLNGHLHGQGWLALIERGGLKGGHARANEWQAQTPPVTGGVEENPTGKPRQPHRETASTPPGAGAHLVHDLVHELVGRSTINCGGCGQPFPLTEIDAHYDQCDRAQAPDIFDLLADPPTAGEADKGEHDTAAWNRGRAS